jgi:hypothetical protein
MTYEVDGSGVSSETGAMSGVETAQSDSDELVRRLLVSAGRMLLCVSAAASIVFGVGLGTGIDGFVYGLWVGVPRLLLPTVISTVGYELAMVRIGRGKQLGPLLRHAIALAIVLATAATFFMFNVGMFPPQSAWHLFWSVHWLWVQIGLVGALLMPWVTLRRSVDGTQ